MGSTVIIIIVISFFVFIILFTLAARYGTMYAGRILGTKINATHRALEYILDTDMIPREWIGAAPGEPSKVDAWKRRQKRKAIKRLKQLRSYVENTPSISDLESREYVLSELRRIEEKWIQGDIIELTEVRSNR